MKKHLALIAVLAAMVALTACGKQTANDSAAETTAPVTDAETTEEETTEPPPMHLLQRATPMPAPLTRSVRTWQCSLWTMMPPLTAP